MILSDPLSSSASRILPSGCFSGTLYNALHVAYTVYNCNSLTNASNNGIPLLGHLNLSANVNIFERGDRVAVRRSDPTLRLLLLCELADERKEIVDSFLRSLDMDNQARSTKNQRFRQSSSTFRYLIKIDSERCGIVEKLSCQ